MRLKYTDIKVRSRPLKLFIFLRQHKAAQIQQTEGEGGWSRGSALEFLSVDEGKKWRWVAVSAAEEKQKTYVCFCVSPCGVVHLDLSHVD